MYNLGKRFSDCKAKKNPVCFRRGTFLFAAFFTHRNRVFRTGKAVDSG